MNNKEFVVLAVSTLIFGLVLGGYLGTVLYRVRINAPFLTRKCYCPVCKHPLLLRDQIAIIGYILLRGKCRYCKSKISPVYPVREAFTGLYYLITFILSYKSPIIMLVLWLIMPLSAFIYVAVRYKAHVVKAYLNLLLMTLPYNLLAFLLCKL